MPPPVAEFIFIAILASAVGQAIQRAFREEPDIDATRGLRANTRDPSAKLPIVYGQLRVGGNDVFIEAAGTDNNILYVVQTLSEGPCDSIVSDHIYLAEELLSEYGTDANYYFHSGTADQAVDATISAEIEKYTDPLHYTCYGVWRLTYNADKFQGLPERSVELKGRKLYDFRTGETVWSNNPVLALYDYMTNERYGYGYPASRIDLDTWISAATYCEAKGWTINMRVDRDQPGHDVIDDICNLFHGQYVWYDGKIYLKYSDLNYESSCMTLNDSHIVQAQGGVAEIEINEPGTFGVPEGLRISYVDAEKEFVEDTVFVGDKLGAFANVTLNGCTNRQQATDLGVYLLERIRLDRTISGTFRDDALRLEAHDVVMLTSETFGITNQLMRVQQASIRQDGLIDLILSYEARWLYDDDYQTDVTDAYVCSFPSPSDEPPAVANVNIAEETYFYRMRNFTRLKVTFTSPAKYPFFDHAEVWISLNGDVPANYEHQYNVKGSFSIENAEEGQDYWIRLKTVSIHGVKQQDENDYKLRHVVAGYTDVPPSLPGLNIIVNGTAVNLYSTKLDSPDIEHYEFRLGASWSGGIFLAAMRAPNLSLTGVKPGEHIFWINTYGTNGQYGTSPQSAGCTLIDPPDGWTVQSTQTCDYQESDDDHQNTEHVLYGGDDYLKCSHGSAGLNGTYLSPTYDEGASDRFLVYILADTVITGEGSTWEDILTMDPGNPFSPTTWEELSADERSWAEIINLQEASQIRMRVNYGETDSLGNTVEQMEILSAIITGRYFQVEIEITDPSYAVNGLVENFVLKFCK